MSRLKWSRRDEVLGIGLMDTQWPDDAWIRLASSADVINQQPSRSAIESGLVLDLNPMFDADPTTRPDDFLPATLEECQWDGGTWCVPIHASYQVIFFDKDAFDAVGEAYPEPGWTWDDFLDTAAALTERDGAEVTQWGFVLPWPQHVDLVDSWAGPLINESTDPPQPLLDNPAVAEAVRWYTDLYLEYEVMPNYEIPDEVEATYVSEGQQLIDEGRAAMWTNSSLLWDWLSQQRNLGVAPFPVDAPGAQGAGDMTTPMGIDAVSISAGTAQPQAAYRWATFISQQPTELLGLKMLSARRSVIESGGFWEGAAPEYQETMEFAIEHSYTRQWSSGYSAISAALTAILNGEKTVEDALADAQEQAEQDIVEALAAGEDSDAGAHRGGGRGTRSWRGRRRHNDRLYPGYVRFAQPGRLSAIWRIVSTRAIPTSRSISSSSTSIAVLHPSFPEIAADCDCFVWAPQLQSPENLDAILSLEPFLDADTSFDIGDFYPVMVSRFEHQGQLWGLPSEASTYVIQYNKDLFDAAGVDYPSVSAGWTIDDFLAAASAVASGEGDARIWGFLPNYYEVNDLIFLMERTGAELLDAGQDPPSLDLTGASVQDALQWYVDLSNEYDVKPVYVGDIAELLVSASGTMEREALIDSGNAAMWTAIGTLDILGTHEGLNLGVVPLPAPASGSIWGLCLGRRVLYLGPHRASPGMLAVDHFSERAGGRGHQYPSPPLGGRIGSIQQQSRGGTRCGVSGNHGLGRPAVVAPVPGR